MKRTASRIIGAILAGFGLASTFNTNASAGHIRADVRPVPVAPRKRGLRTGIKGMASSNNTRNGANLKAYFDQRGTKLNKFGVMVKA